MPSMSRPSAFDTLFSSNDELAARNAQMVWDLLEAQEKANELKKMELEGKEPVQHYSTKSSTPYTPYNYKEKSALAELLSGILMLIWGIGYIASIIAPVVIARQISTEYNGILQTVLPGLMIIIYPLITLPFIRLMDK